MTLLKNFLHKPLSGAPKKCFQSAPALAKASPMYSCAKVIWWNRSIFESFILNLDENQTRENEHSSE